MGRTEVASTDMGQSTYSSKIAINWTYFEIGMNLGKLTCFYRPYERSVLKSLFTTHILWTSNFSKNRHI